MHKMKSLVFHSVQQCAIQLCLCQAVLPRQSRAAKFLVSWGGLLRERRADAEGGAGARARPGAQPGGGVVLET